MKNLKCGSNYQKIMLSKEKKEQKREIFDKNPFELTKWTVEYKNKQNWTKKREKEENLSKFWQEYF